MTRSVLILGATGSIGTQALDVIARSAGRLVAVGLAAGHDSAALHALAARAGVHELAAAEPGDADADADVRVRVGPDAIVRLVREVRADVVLNAIDGAAGLPATLAALETGATLALANKESLVVGGELVTERARPGQLVPVDSEHSAIAQCLRSGTHDEVDRLILTASGGPFRGRAADELWAVTPQQALAHPTWRMGVLVTTNSATLVNKGLEIMEAHHLFGIGYDRIDAVVHPQSVVHSMVQFRDGATIAQASPPDMRLPISLALAWPHRMPDVVPAVDWTHSHRWTFEPIDEEAFPAVRLARAVGERGGTWPAVFTAADEVLVARFHAGGIAFPEIVAGIERVVDAWRPSAGSLSLDAIARADAWAREQAAALPARGRGR